jgi:hypothetical protein
MKRTIQLLVTAICGALVMTASQGAFAVPLSAQDCHGFPFVKTGDTTHQDRMHELSLYEQAGYNPGRQDPEYPNSIETANHVLHQSYEQYCMKR